MRKNRRPTECHSERPYSVFNFCNPCRVPRPVVVLLWLFTVTASVFGQTRQGPTSRPKASSPVITRQTTFAIPFQVSPTNHDDQRPVEVQLFVSDDRGANWQLYKRADPASATIRFRADQDGEYWFTVRTLDREGRSFPPQPYAAELRVLVDTTPPKLALFVGTGIAGELRTHWEIHDRQLETGSLKIEFQPNDGAPWQPVAVESHQKGNSGRNLIGQATWWPRSDSAHISVRAEVRDRAGNSAVVHRRVELPKVKDVRRSAEVRDGFGRRSDGSVGWPAEMTTNRPLQDSSNVRKQQTTTKMPFKVPPARKPDLREITSFEIREIDVKPRTERSPRDLILGPNSRNQLTSTPKRDPFRRIDPESALQAEKQSSSTKIGLPPGAAPNVIRTLRFNLDYEIEAGSESGIREVQLWGTNDGGRNWQKWHVDEDQRSPLAVAVPGEGAFGFRIVIENSQQMAGQTPQPGDPADLWVIVDLTAPLVQLHSARYGTGRDAGRLQIQWTARDTNLDTQPVTIMYRDASQPREHLVNQGKQGETVPDGNWVTLASARPNSGQHDWLIGNSVPTAVNLRIEVRDRAGNVGVAVLPEPVRLEPLLPKGRIRGLRPL